MKLSTSAIVASIRLVLACTLTVSTAGWSTPSVPEDCAERHKSLIAWWKAEGDATDQFSMHDGETPFGIAYANGVVGQAFDFDGTWRRVSVPDSPDFKLVNAMTLEAWVYPRAYQGFITFRGDNRGGLDTWTLDAYEPGHVKFTIIDETNGFARVLAPLALNQWQHVAATWDRDSGDMKVFVNGTLAAQTNTTVVPIGNLDAEAAVGIGNHGGTFHQFPFNGLIDELGIYSRALSSDEVAAIYQAGSAGKCVTNPPPPDPITVINGPLTNQANGSVYYLLSPTTWTLSEATAITMGGHLATINDEEENTWVISTFGNDGKALWIGLNDIETEGTYVWSSGETSAFRNWSPGEPNNHHGWEDHTYIVEIDPGYPLIPGQWADTTDTGFNPGSGEGVNHPLHGVVEVAGDTPPLTNPPCPPTSDLVAYYPFTGNADDQSGYGNHGTVVSATLTNDLLGTPLQAMAFAGNGVINCGNGSAFQFRQSDFTLSLLVKTPTNTSGPFKCLLTKDRCYQQGSQFRLETRNGMVAFGLTDRTGAQFGTWSGGWWRLRAPLPAGIWSHVAVVREGVELRLYVNGELGSSFSMSGSPDHQSANNFLIGARYGCTATYGDFFAGELDEVRVYQRALDQEEVQTVFLHDSQGVCPTNPPPPSLPPVITSVTPNTGTVGAQLTVTGLRFSPDPAEDIVHFGAVRGIVTAASTTELIVNVPAGATHAPITVNVEGLVASAPTPFQPTFTGNGSPISSSTLEPRFDLAGGDGAHRAVIADLDGDSRPDLAVADVYGHTVSLFRNIASPGALEIASFEPRVVLPAEGGDSDNPYGFATADVDGDGRLDLIACDRIGNNILVYRNIASPGSLTAASFAPHVNFPVGADPRYARVADLDGDGRPDIVSCNFAGNTLSVLRNVGGAGTLQPDSFAPHVEFAADIGPYDVAVGDLDGDGRPDLAVVNTDAPTLSLFRNVSTPGNIDSNSFAPRVDCPAAEGNDTIALGDLDGDGRPDLVIGSFRSLTVSVYRNQASPGSLTTDSFAPRVDFSTDNWTHTVALADLNGDGRPDIVSVGELNSYLSVFENLSTPGSFTASSLGSRVDFGAGWNGWGVAAGDLDLDGRMDIVFCNAYDDTVSVYRNASPQIQPPPTETFLVNVDLGAGPGPSAKTGPAAVGLTPSDLWNFYTRDDGMGGWLTLGAVPNLKHANGTITSVGLIVSNAPGAWSLNSTDPMYNTYIYPYPTDTGNATLTLTNLPQGGYEVYVYGGDGNYEVSVEGTSHGIRHTLDDTPVNPPVWQEGKQYARWTNVLVGADQSLVVTVRQGIYGYAIVSGLQIRGAAGNVEPGCSLPDDLVSWWKSEDNALDSVGPNHAALVNGTTFSDGMVGRAFNFDGTDDRVNVSNAPSLNFGPNEDLSIECWIQAHPNSNPSNVRAIVDKRSAAENYRGYTLFLWDGFLSFQLGELSSGVNFFSFGADLRDNVFHHVAVTVDRDSVSGGRLFVDGQVIYTFDPTGLMGDLANADVLRIGHHAAPGDSSFFEGVIDEVSLYRRALTIDEVAAIYQAGSAGKCPPNPDPYADLLLNVDLGAGPGPSAKTGPAAIGLTAADFWNFYTRDDGLGGWLTLGAVPNLKHANGATTSVGLIVSNAPGAWGLESTDPMYNTYIYPYPTDTGNATLTLTNLPQGGYEVYVYGGDGNYEVSVGDTSHGIQQTLDDGPLINPPLWQEGKQYARWTNVLVGADQSLVVTVRQGVYGYAIISGLQVKSTAPAPPVVATIPQQPILHAVPPTEPSPMRLAFSGLAGATYVVEASTNMVEWVTIGWATEVESGQFVFEDAETWTQPCRFYRVLTP